MEAIVALVILTVGVGVLVGMTVFKAVADKLDNDEHVQIWSLGKFNLTKESDDDA